MAKDVITRFKLETTGFDSKIKQAAKDLSAYSKTATQAKEGFNQFTKSNIDAAKALGTMATSTTNAKDRAKELVGAFNDAAKAYNSLTKEQQQSDWAKALAGSLTQLQQRIKETKQEMQGLGDSMKGGGGGIFSGLGSKMEGALAVFGGNLMTKAAGAVAQLGSEMADMVKQGVEMAKAGEGVRIAFERLGNGRILDGLREATHGTVTDLELMKAAVKFNDFKLPVEELGTMLAFAQQKAKDTGQSVDYMVDSIVTGLGRKSLMILDNLGLSAAEIKDKMKDTGDMTKAVGAIIREQMAKAGDYVETAADRAAQANVNMQNKMEELGRKFAPLQEASNSLWTSMKIGILDVIGGPLTDLLNKLTEAGRLRNALNNINGDGTKGNTQVSNKLKQLQAAKNSGASQYILNTMQSGVVEGYNRQINEREQAIKDWKSWRSGNRSEGLQQRVGQWRDKYGTDVNSIKAEADAYRAMIAEYRKGAKDIMTPVTVDVKPTKPTNPTKTTKEDIQFADDSIMAQEKLVSDLTQKWKTASGELRDGYLKQLEDAQQKLAEMTGKAKVKAQPVGMTFTAAQLEGMSFDNQMPTIRGNNGRAQDKLDLATAAFATGGISNIDFSTYISGIKNAMSNANLGSELYNSMTEKLKDATTVSTLLQELMERGVAGADLENIAKALKEKLLSPEGIDQTAVQSFLEEYKKQLEEAGGVGLKLNPETGEVTDDKGKGSDDLEDMKKFNEGIGKLTGGLSQVTGGLKAVGVEIPKEVDQVIGVINGVSQIISGVGTIISIFGTSAMTANTAALGANTFAIGALITAIELNTATNIFPFANGGIVPAFAQGGLIGRAAGGLMIPGNSMSGDRLRLPVDGGLGMIGVNSGELILNRAQQGNLASQLEGGGMENLHLEARMDTEEIVFSVNQYLGRTSNSEMAKSRN